MDLGPKKKRKDYALSGFCLVVAGARMDLGPHEAGTPSLNTPTPHRVCVVLSFIMDLPLCMLSWWGLPLQQPRTRTHTRTLAQQKRMSAGSEGT